MITAMNGAASSTDTSYPSFLLSPTAILHPRKPYTHNSGLLDCDYQYETGPESPPPPPRSLAAAAACSEMDAASQWPGALAGYLLQPGRLQLGDVHFSQNHCQPPILHLIVMQWSERTERAPAKINKQSMGTRSSVVSN